MSKDIVVGRFSIDVWNPSPVWIQLSIDGEQVASIGHYDLRDLQYAIERAIHSAEGKLGKKI